jgi:hypothetical protein
VGPCARTNQQRSGIQLSHVVISTSGVGAGATVGAHVGSGSVGAFVHSVCATEQHPPTDKWSGSIPHTPPNVSQYSESEVFSVCHQWSGARLRSDTAPLG